MANEDGAWIRRGLSVNDPMRIKSTAELTALIEELGFLPLFAGRVPGFSVEEHTAARHWWSDDPAVDPWLWRELLAREGKVAYGKFFGGRAGFVSLRWLPRFANWRRDGYDFDALWQDQKASRRSKKIMDLFQHGEELFSFQVRRDAGFGKEGEKNFEGTVTSLMMQTYLIMRDFRQRVNRAGQPYGWPIAVYAAPESVWGYELLSSAYEEDPKESRTAILRHLGGLFPGAPEGSLEQLI